MKTGFVTAINRPGRTTTVGCAVIALLLSGLAPFARGQDYPTKPIRLIVGSSPGGPIMLNSIPTSVPHIGSGKLRGNSPEEFGKLLRAELPKWAKVVQISGAKVD